MDDTNGKGAGVSEDSATRKLVREMVERKGIPEAERADEEKRILGLLEDMVQDEVISALPTEKLEELNDLLDDEDFSEEELVRILSSSEVTAEEAARRVLDEFYREYLGLDMEEKNVRK